MVICFLRVAVDNGPALCAVALADTIVLLCVLGCRQQWSWDIIILLFCWCCCVLRFFAEVNVVLFLHRFNGGPTAGAKKKYRRTETLCGSAGKRILSEYVQNLFQVYVIGLP
jgi:hypothetical protein